MLALLTLAAGRTLTVAVVDMLVLITHRLPMSSNCRQGLRATQPAMAEVEVKAFFTTSSTIL